MCDICLSCRNFCNPEQNETRYFLVEGYFKQNGSSDEFYLCDKCAFCPLPTGGNNYRKMDEGGYVKIQNKEFIVNIINRINS